MSRIHIPFPFLWVSFRPPPGDCGFAWGRFVLGFFVRGNSSLFPEHSRTFSLVDGGPKLSDNSHFPRSGGPWDSVAPFRVLPPFSFLFCFRPGVHLLSPPFSTSLAVRSPHSVPCVRRGFPSPPVGLPRVFAGPAILAFISPRVELTIGLLARSDARFRRALVPLHSDFWARSAQHAQLKISCLGQERVVIMPQLNP